VNGLVIGDEYALEFWTGGEWTLSQPTWFNNDGLFALDAGFGNIFLRNPPTPNSTGIGRRFVVVFTATSSSHTIKFTNWGHIGGTFPYPCTELIFDDVQLFKKANVCLTGIANASETPQPTVFPNPFTDQLNITGNHEKYNEFIVYDISG
jgi:hypothetical protein